MEKDVSQLESENKRLVEALVKARGKLKELQEIFDGVNDLIEEKDNGHVTEDDLKNLLKKYSGL